MSSENWEFDEMNQVGANYNDLNRAKTYDEYMTKFRDYKKEANSIINYINLKKNQKIIDFGCGTGAFTTEFAKNCKEVIAVDVSDKMLNILKSKAKDLGLNNIKYVNKGFLTYEHSEEQVDAIITKSALHHLPDFWKFVVLKKMSKMIKFGGYLFLSDVIFSFDIEDYEGEIKKFINNIDKNTDGNLTKDSILHIKEEFSTFDWVIEEFLIKSGFKITKKIKKGSANIDYFCIKA
jgi:ubiquinone/menaquinone biosynthesis C-methylase UbiE